MTAAGLPKEQSRAHGASSCPASSAERISPVTQWKGGHCAGQGVTPRVQEPPSNAPHLATERWDIDLGRHKCSGERLEEKTTTVWCFALTDAES